MEDLAATGVTGSGAARIARRSGAAAYLALTKPRQTGLLMATAIGAYLMGAVQPVEWTTFAVGMLALGAAISGSTALNMVLDRDIDRIMERTHGRPLPSGLVPASRAVAFGIALSAVGVGAALVLGPLFGALVTAGLLFDVVIYTWWLKRRTAASILVGGVAGGMPALAARTLAVGSVDAVGLLLAAGVVLWIPAHILTLAMKHADEYAEAKVPTWSNVHGESSARRLIAVATVGAAVVLVIAGVLEAIGPLALGALVFAGVTISALALYALARPGEQRDWMLFKAASVYMLVAFVCLTVGAVV